MTDARRCEHCGEPLPVRATRRRRFCDDYCRVTHARAEKRRRAESPAVSDKFVVKVHGSVSLDPSDPRDAELWNRLKLAEDVTLQIEGRVSKLAKTYLGDREGESVGVKLEANVGIHTVYRPNDAE
jgi:CRISPR/Cas system-associated protein Cas10 (large subunit of type III CRISPR-Cas system)